MTLTIVSYGVGNVQAFANVYHRLGVPWKFATTPAELEGATRVILPGVGAFDWAMQRLAASGMYSRIEHLVADEGVPVLGVCVGMQMLARSSEEGKLPGLGWIPATVCRFADNDVGVRTRLPHMGWNDVHVERNHPLFRNLDRPRFYFLHSYYFLQDNVDDIIATADYFGRFTAAVGRRRIFGVQFHPEKSHQWGVQLLKNFAEL